MATKQVESWGVPWEEAFGYVQLEAMAAGTPVISTDVPSGVSWVNQDGRTGLIVRAGDAEALRQAIARLIDDGGLRAALGAAGRARVEEEFTMGRLRERLRLLYVGCTRARDHLVVSVHRVDRDPPDDDTRLTSAELLWNAARSGAGS